jgi:hypothetical protein
MIRFILQTHLLMQGFIFEKVFANNFYNPSNSVVVTPDFPKETKCIPICMPGSSFMHIVT